MLMTIIITVSRLETENMWSDHGSFHHQDFNRHCETKIKIPVDEIYLLARVKICPSDFIE